MDLANFAISSLVGIFSFWTIFVPLLEQCWTTFKMKVNLVIKKPRLNTHWASNWMINSFYYATAKHFWTTYFRTTSTFRTSCILFRTNFGLNLCRDGETIGPEKWNIDDSDVTQIWSERNREREGQVELIWRACQSFRPSLSSTLMPRHVSTYVHKNKDSGRLPRRWLDGQLS